MYTLSDSGLNRSKNHFPLGLKEFAFKSFSVHSLVSLALVMLLYSLLLSQPSHPQLKCTADLISARFDAYDLILEPDTDKPEWWAGAPSVVRDSTGMFYMACRMRTADAPRGLRGYEIRLLESSDGIHFRRIGAIAREAVPIPGFERPALLIDPVTKKFKLYACGPWQGGPFSIIKFNDVDRLQDIDPASAKPVIQPMQPLYERDITVLTYKDPVIFYQAEKKIYHCFVIGYIRRNEKIFHFTSKNGEDWTPVGDPHDSLLPLAGWHDFFVRPASVVPIGVGYLFFYEGSSAKWYDPVYNVVTGVGFTFDLHHIIDLTPDNPLVKSTTPGYFSTWRYSHWMRVEDELWAYAEVADTNNSHEIRLFRIKLQ